MKSLILLLSVAVLFAVNSCKNSEKTDDFAADFNDSLDVSVQRTKHNAENVFNSLPDRKEILKLVDENGLTYDPDILNNPEFIKNYNTEVYIALNLGVYGSDLSVTSVFEQTQESLLFLKCVNSMAQKLGVNKAFDQSMFDRLEAQRDNKDSTMAIISTAFKGADEILKSNNRPVVSALIIAGVWIEGFYTSCKIAQKTPSEGILEAIIKQKTTLDNVLVLLKENSLSDDAKFVLNDLSTISAILNEAVQNNKAPYSLETVAPVYEAVSRLRAKVVTAS